MLKSERRNSSDFSAQISACNRMRVLCGESATETHPLANKTNGQSIAREKSIANMSAEEFSHLLDVASPEELNALAFAGGQKKATAVGRPRSPMSAEYRRLGCERASSPGAVGWGAPMHCSLLFISWLVKPFANKSSLVARGCAVVFLLMVILEYARVLRWAIFH